MVEDGKEESAGLGLGGIDLEVRGKQARIRAIDEPDTGVNWTEPAKPR